MEKSILRMTGLVAVVALFCVLYVTCNDNGAGNGKLDDRADAFVSKFNRRSSGGENGNSGGNHVHQWGGYVTTIPATCEAAGVETRTCILDATHKDTRAIAKLTGTSCDPTHTHEWGEWDTTTYATCTAEGLITRICETDPSHKDTKSIPMLVGASCDPTKFTLRIYTDPDGIATVTRNPDKEYYEVGDTVILLAQPDDGYVFYNWRLWQGDADTTVYDDYLRITIRTNIVIVANFLQVFTISISAGEGGSVEISPSKEYYNFGDVVIVKAIPNSGYRFTEWKYPDGRTDERDWLPIRIERENVSLEAIFESL